MANEFSKVPVDEGAILLTGATGLLGGEVLARLLARTDRTVVALVRRPLGFEHPRLHLLMADLTEDAPLPAPPVPVSQVIHCAASVSFTLPIEEQREINVEGTRRLLDLAATFEGLERFMHVSTAYVAGDFEGTFGPDDLERGQGFRNTYEQSKHEAEVLVNASGLPTQVVRPAIVVGDQYTGRTNAFNVLYPPMKAYALGKLHVAPGRAEAPVDVVPIDFVADAMMELLDIAPGRTHLLAACENATTVGELVQLGADYFDRPVGQIMSAQQLDDLIDQLPDDAREKARLGLERAAHVLPYFDVRADYRDPLTKEFLASRGIEARPLRDYFENLMDYATEVDWGKAPERVAA
ncbi:MAG: SDR family oxidoreductase [Solirubrobacteraceae bacterium]|nr:SDR family oxidoreductase [Solirubrobacteraceae bacterium]